MPVVKTAHISCNQKLESMGIDHWSVFNVAFLLINFTINPFPKLDRHMVSTSFLSI
jgi:hypothetical protein